MCAAKVISQAYLVGVSPADRKKRIEAVVREVFCMGKLDSPYCIKVREFIKTEKYFYII
jgi:hypothetical protein